MKGTIHFEIHGEDFGEGGYSHKHFDSIAIFCPYCGDIWARLKSDFHSSWRYTGRACDKHEQVVPFEVPGTLYMKWEPQIEEAMPRVVLLREWSVYDRCNKPILATEESLTRGECNAAGSERLGQDVQPQDAHS
jgi:hypothetical protein